MYQIYFGTLPKGRPSTRWDYSCDCFSLNHSTNSSSSTGHAPSSSKLLMSSSIVVLKANNMSQTSLVTALTERSVKKANHCSMNLNRLARVSCHIWLATSNAMATNHSARQRHERRGEQKGYEGNAKANVKDTCVDGGCPSKGAAAWGGVSRRVIWGCHSRSVRTPWPGSFVKRKQKV